jgi:predicted TPR repeat methyltransferase
MEGRKPKYFRYQDYVIRDGKLVGEFEQMYRDHEDPWCLTKLGLLNPTHVIAENIVQRLYAGGRVRTAVEVGCGLGHLTKRIRDIGVDVLGIDIAPSAVEKARQQYPECKFAVADVSAFDVIEGQRPDLVILAEVTWYVLAKLDDFIQFLRTRLPHAYLLHLLAVYPPGQQLHGLEKFSNLEEMKRYFGMVYLEWGEQWTAEKTISGHTYLLGRWPESEAIG